MSYKKLFVLKIGHHNLSRTLTRKKRNVLWRTFFRDYKKFFGIMNYINDISILKYKSITLQNRTAFDSVD